MRKIKEIGRHTLPPAVYHGARRPEDHIVRAMNSFDDSQAPQLAPGCPGKPPVHHHGIGSRIRNYFLTGLVVAGPLAITVWLTWSFITWVDNLVRPFIPVAYRPETYLPGRIPGSGLIIAVFALTMLGFLTANLVGRTLVEAGERICRARLRHRWSETHRCAAGVRSTFGPREMFGLSASDMPSASASRAETTFQNSSGLRS